MSLDALRGFDMFWIIGADSLVYALHRLSQSKPTEFLAYELNHSNWEGFHFYDLIFPLFVFMAGVSLVFSLSKTIASVGRARALKRIFIRSLLLYALGIFEYGGFANLWPGIRLLGVLQRIALAYFFAGCAFAFSARERWRPFARGCSSAIGRLMTFVPFPDVRPTPQTQTIARESGFTNVSHLSMTSTHFIRGTFIEGVNLCNYVDQKYLPGCKWDGTWDPEGILSTIPAVGTCLLGVFAGLLLQDQKIKDRRKVIYLLSFGVAGVALGLALGIAVPRHQKNLDIFLRSGGWRLQRDLARRVLSDCGRVEMAALVPAVCLDGMNSITIYMTDNILGSFANPAQRLAGGTSRHSSTHAWPKASGN